MPANPVILHYLHRDNFGGGPKNVVQVIDALDGMGEQHVVTTGVGRLTEQVKSRKAVTLHEVSDVSSAFFPVTVWQLSSLLKKLRPQVVLTHGQWGGMLMGMALRMGPPTKAVFVTQWCSLYESRDMWRAARNWCAEWLAFSKHQHIVCASEGNVRQFLYAGLLADRCRVTVIPNPVEPSALVDPQIVARLVPPAKVEGSKTFVFMGRLERQKRPDWLLRAWKLALDGGLANARLLVMGDGSWRPKCEDLIRTLGISSSVQMLGHRTDGASYLQNSDGLLLTSLYEGHANVVLEAQALGIPVLAMDADGVREGFPTGEYSQLSPLGDVTIFARELIALARADGMRAKPSAALLPAEGHAVAYRRLVVEMLDTKV